MHPQVLPACHGNMLLMGMRAAQTLETSFNLFCNMRKACPGLVLLSAFIFRYKSFNCETSHPQNIVDRCFIMIY